jgi:geranylgeranyl diphosphate synthase type I
MGKGRQVDGAVLPSAERASGMKSTDLGQWAKNKLDEYIPTIDRNLDRYFEGEIGLGSGFNQKQKDMVLDILRHAREHNLRKAKRLRGSFVKYGFLLGGGKENGSLEKAEMSVELVHTALLMQDDVMDRDMIRRGGLTTHKFYQEKAKSDLHYGESMAVSISDTILCLGFNLLLGSGFDTSRIKPALGQLLRGVANTAYGQAYDVSLEVFGRWTENDVIVLHKAKTAIYTYENPLFIGAHLAGLPKKAFEILHEYAMDGGIAFQLQDDILGVYGDEEKTGKSADSDIRQGKCTLLVLKVFTDGTPAQQAAVRKVWGKFDLARREDLDAAKQAIRDSGSYEYSKRLAREYATKAARTAGKLRKLNLDPEAIDYIQGIAEYMAVREV